MVPVQKGGSERVLGASLKVWQFYFHQTILHLTTPLLYDGYRLCPAALILEEHDEPTHARQIIPRILWHTQECSLWKVYFLRENPLPVQTIGHYVTDLCNEARQLIWTANGLFRDWIICDITGKGKVIVQIRLDLAKNSRYLQD